MAKSCGAVLGCPGDLSVADPAYNQGLVRVGLTGDLLIKTPYPLHMNGVKNEWSWGFDM